jgi:DNA relaxase NicK
VHDHFSLPPGGNKPPACNTGVNSLSGARICPSWGLDWLRLSFPESDVHFLTESLLASGFHPSPSRGKHGYTRGYEFRDDPLSTGEATCFIWWGGDAMQSKATIEVPGSSSETLFLALSRLSVAFSVRRVDLRIDYDGVAFLTGQDAIVNVLENWPYRGITPKYHKIDDMGQGTGSTLYVGSRSGSCLIRWYEKGLQMRDPMRPNWCRFEVELKPKKFEQGLIMWAMLVHGKRDQLARSGFSAAFLPYFVSAENADKIIIPPEQKVRDFDGRIDVMVTQYGGLIGEMLQRSGGDWIGVSDMLQRAFQRKAEVLSLASKRPISHLDEQEIPY